MTTIDLFVYWLTSERDTRCGEHMKPLYSPTEKLAIDKIIDELHSLERLRHENRKAILVEDHFQRTGKLIFQTVKLEESNAV